MMLSPEAYVEFEIKGKPKEEVLEIIEELRKDVEELKEIVKRKDPADYKMTPSPKVQLSMQKGYLAAVKKYAKEQGWV